jgi:hypothetical protein
VKKIWLILLPLAVLAGIWWWPRSTEPPNLGDLRYLMGKVQHNYGAEVDTICRKHRLPPEYFKALILLECGGQKPAPSRFEAGVLEKLQAIQAGTLDRYSGITAAHLQGRSAAELRLLATSWGPMQIMGYHALLMGVSVDDLKGQKAVFYGIKWSKELYGRYLREYRLKDAFHFHNRGRPYPSLGPPQTHDPYYVDRGLIYAEVLK